MTCSMMALVTLEIKVDETSASYISLNALTIFRVVIPFGVQTMNFIIHPGKSCLTLANDLRFETAVTITWDINIEGAILSL
jgi:hypothetical protein